MRKGIAPLFVLLIVLAIAGGITAYYHFGIGEEVNNAVEGAGQWIIVAINEVENAKRMDKDMLLFATYQGIYDFGKNGGALPTDEKVYWSKLDHTMYPDELAFKNNLQQIIETRLNYMIDSSMEYSVGKVDTKLSYFTLNPIDIESSHLTVSAVAKSAITSSSDIAVVSSTFATDRTVDTKIFRLYELGKAVISELKDYINGKKTQDEINSALSSFKIKKDSDYSSENIGSGFVLSSIGQNSVEILVKLTDKNKEYPIFDSAEGKNKYDFVSLEFYVTYAI